jgi:predicted transcriptional regulator
MQRQSTLPTADIVKKARLKTGLSQGDFGLSLEKSQGVISRYEKGLVTPPGNVLMHCMHILEDGIEEASAGDPDWDAVLAALDSLSSAIRGMKQRSVRTKSQFDRNRNR